MPNGNSQQNLFSAITQEDLDNFLSNIQTPDDSVDNQSDWKKQSNELIKSLFNNDGTGKLQDSNWLQAATGHENILNIDDYSELIDPIRQEIGSESEWGLGYLGRPSRKDTRIFKGLTDGDVDEVIRDAFNQEKLKKETERFLNYVDKGVKNSTDNGKTQEEQLFQFSNIDIESYRNNENKYNIAKGMRALEDTTLTEERRRAIENQIRKYHEQEYGDGDVTTNEMFLDLSTMNNVNVTDEERKRDKERFIDLTDDVEKNKSEYEQIPDGTVLKTELDRVNMGLHGLRTEGNETNDYIFGLMHGTQVNKWADKYGYQVNEIDGMLHVNNVKFKDIIPATEIPGIVVSKEIFDKYKDEGLDFKELKKKDESFEDEVERYKDSTIDLTSKKIALKDLYYQNRNPEFIKTGWGGFRPDLFLESAGIGIFGDKFEWARAKDYEDNGIFGYSNRALLDAIDEETSNLGITMSSDQKEKFDRNFGEMATEGVGGATGILLQLTALNKVQGTVMAGTRLGKLFTDLTAARYISKSGRIFKRSNIQARAQAAGMTEGAYAAKFLGGVTKAPTNYFNKLMGHSMMVMFEEAKMGAVGFEPGVGMGFYAGGKFIQGLPWKLPRFENYNRLNTMIKAVGQSGPAFAMGTKTGDVVASLIDEIANNKQFTTAWEEHYPEGFFSNENMKKTAVDLVIGSILGMTHLKKTDVMSSRNLNRLERYTRLKWQRAVRDGNLKEAARFKDLWIPAHQRKLWNERLELYSNPLTRDKAWKDKAKGLQDAYRKEGKVLEVEVSYDDAKYADKTDKGGFEPGKGGNPSKLYIHPDRATPGVLPHEGAHALKHLLFENKYIEGKFLNTITDALKKIKIEGKDGAKNVYEGILQLKNIKSIDRGEEMMAYLAEYLSKKDVHNQLIGTSAFKNISQTFISWAERNGLMRPNIKSKPSDLIDYLGRYTNSIKSGYWSTKQFKILEDILTDIPTSVDAKGKPYKSTLGQKRKTKKGSAELEQEGLREVELGEKDLSYIETELSDKDLINNTLVETIKNENTPSAERNTAIKQLIARNPIIYQALGYSKTKGDIKQADIDSAIQAELLGSEGGQGILKTFDPTKSQFSTYLKNTFGRRREKIYKLAGLDAKKLVTSSIDAEKSKEIPDTDLDIDTKIDAVGDKGKYKIKVLDEFVKKYPKFQYNVSDLLKTLKTIKPKEIVGLDIGKKHESKFVDAIHKFVEIKSTDKPLQKLGKLSDIVKTNSELFYEAIPEPYDIKKGLTQQVKKNFPSKWFPLTGKRFAFKDAPKTFSRSKAASGPLLAEKLPYDQLGKTVKERRQAWNEWFFGGTTAQSLSRINNMLKQVGRGVARQNMILEFKKPGVAEKIIEKNPEFGRRMTADFIIQELRTAQGKKLASAELEVSNITEGFVGELKAGLYMLLGKSDISNRGIIDILEQLKDPNNTLPESIKQAFENTLETAYAATAAKGEKTTGLTTLVKDVINTKFNLKGERNNWGNMSGKKWLDLPWDAKEIQIDKNTTITNPKKIWVKELNDFAKTLNVNPKSAKAFRSLFGFTDYTVGEVMSRITNPLIKSIDASFKSKGKKGFYSEKLEKQIENFIKTAPSTYAPAIVKQGFKDILEAKTLKKQFELTQKLFKNKDFNNLIKLYDIQNKALTEWLHKEEVGTQRFKDKLNTIIRIKKNNALAGTIGERALAPIKYILFGQFNLKAEGFRRKVEHLKPSNEQSKSSLQAIANNTYGSHVTRGYRGILGMESGRYGFSSIEGKGKLKNINESDIFRFQQNLPLAKKIYSIDKMLDVTWKEFNNNREKYTLFQEMKEVMTDGAIKKIQRDVASNKKANLKLAKKQNMLGSSKLSNNELMDRINAKAEAVAKSRDPNAPRKGASILDFDDTVAKTKSMIKYEIPRYLPDGRFNPAVVGWGKIPSKGKLTPEQFAKQHAKLEAYGAKFDYSEFSKVIGGEKGPLFKKLQKIQEKYGTKNTFILTARPQEAAPAIRRFLKELGVDIPLKNIKGLEDGRPGAKSSFIVDRAVEGYNDFYFVDDVLKNVEAVKKTLDLLDVKGKVHQAKKLASAQLEKDFNKILEETTGVEVFKEFSKGAAKIRGAGKGKWNLWLPPSAEGFLDLMYKTFGRGKKGDSHMKWYDKVLGRPYAKGFYELNKAKQRVHDDYEALKKRFPEIKKIINKDSGYNKFTNDAAARVYLWNKNGFEIPELSKRDVKELVKIVESNSNLRTYAEQVSKITGLKEGYVEPTASWLSKSIQHDLMDVSNKIGRKQFFKEWIDNKNKIFTEKTLNKLESQFGSEYRSALEDALYRMEHGSNKQRESTKNEKQFSKWIANATGTVMFLNRRSALTQTISMLNFINWGDNSPLKIAKVFGNQKQFWKDFTMLWNSPMLKQRRKGLTMDVNYEEIVNTIEGKKDKVSAAIAYMLNKGFILTKTADNFAIAFGGASFYRNRLNTYLKQGMKEVEAKEKAFIDFQEASEPTQQSSRPDLISQQQASPLGRFLLTFQNVTMQNNRNGKRAFLDLKNKRGDFKTNLSKIIYYFGVQNAIFLGMQQALFASYWDEDATEDDITKKHLKIGNGLIDSILRGGGMYGVAAATIKNTLLKYFEENEKGWKADEAKVLIEALNLSPPVGSKARKIHSAMLDRKFNKEESVLKPILLATEGATNVPFHEFYEMVESGVALTDEQLQAWQKLAILLGYPEWQVNYKPSDGKNKIKENKASKKQQQLYDLMVN